MKKRIVLPVLLGLFLLVELFATPPSTAKADDGVMQVDDSSGLCLPGNSDLFSGQDCLMQGPAARLQELLAIGITFPPAPMYYTQPPAELGVVPFQYAKVVINDDVPLYLSVEDIEADRPSGRLAAGRIRYVSLYEKAETSKGLYYKIANGRWISREFVSKAAVQYFQGYEFKENPTTAFGWILDATDSRTSPSANAPLTGTHYERYDVVRVYGSQIENKVEWVRIGPNEWIDHIKISRVIPNDEKPEGVTTERWIEINLYEQVMLVHDGDRIIYATMVASGVDPFFTQPGVFKVYKKFVNDRMQGAFEADRSDYYYLEDVPYILYYDQDRALHGAYWHTLFGYQRSHGCVNLSVADSHWLFDWAKDGETVYVWDPSGRTPTDPSAYGSGGF